MAKRTPRQQERQLKPQQLGLLKWQQDFWIVLIERALAGERGLPDLERLKGFKNPAVTRHAVTTPDLLRSFRSYNAGKPYSKQVRPFGFLLMFQQKESTTPDYPAKTQHKRPSTLLRVISPFDRNPAKAARKAFDRDTGSKVSASQLKTYARVLRNYFAHPEAKFLNGDRAERGPTQRRHIVVCAVRHIGKEANRLDDQIAMGVDPSAQLEFGEVQIRKEQLARIRDAVVQFGPMAVSREANVSRQHLHEIVSGTTAPSERMSRRLEEAAGSLQGQRNSFDLDLRKALDRLNAQVREFGLRQTAANIRCSPGHISRILVGKRRPSKTLLSEIADNKQCRRDLE